MGKYNEKEIKQDLLKLLKKEEECKEQNLTYTGEYLVCDEKGNTHIEYCWQGEKVSKEEYEEKLHGRRSKKSHR